jgi:hypothetical protein
MVPVRSLVCSIALVAALAPMSALAAEETESHLQSELTNAVAQKEIAVERSEQMQTRAQLNAQNEMMQAALEAEAIRLRQQGNTANANAIEEITQAVARSMRDLGDLNARNELIIAQGKAAVLLAKADATIANALAQGRQSEIENAHAQGKIFRAAASLISGVLAEANMSSSEVRAEMLADKVHTPGLAEAANGQAQAANKAALTQEVMGTGEVAASSSEIRGDRTANELISHAENSHENAVAMLDEHGFPID